jgi:hypothetical protein
LCPLLIMYFAGGIAPASSLSQGPSASGDFSDVGDELRTDFQHAMRFVQTSDVEKSWEGPHGGGAAALSQRIFFP